MIVQPVVEPMEHYTALLLGDVHVADRQLLHHGLVQLRHLPQIHRARALNSTMLPEQDTCAVIPRSCK